VKLKSKPIPAAAIELPWVHCPRCRVVGSPCAWHRQAGREGFSFNANTGKGRDEDPAQLEIFFELEKNEGGCADD
jgi:hypothetical protein